MSDPEFVRAVCASLCRTLSAEQAARLQEATDPLAIPAQGLVFREGEPGVGLLFLLAGEIEIVKRGRDGTPHPVAVIHAPSLIGEVSLLTDGRHSTTGRAVTDCRMRVLTRDEFRRRLAAEDLVIYKLLGAMGEVIARRLLRLNETLMRIGSRGEGGERIEELERFREKLFSEWSF